MITEAAKDEAARMTWDHNPPRVSEPTAEQALMLKFELYKFTIEHDTRAEDTSTKELIEHLEALWQWMLVGEVPSSDD